MDTPVRVLVVDDDYYAREAMRSLLSRDSRTRVWGLASDVAEALELLGGTAALKAPEVILLDVRLGGAERGGIEGIPAFRAAAPTARILVTSVSNDEDIVASALAAGADGYVWKNESAAGIGTAVVWVAGGRLVVTNSIAERLLGEVTGASEHAAEVLPDQPRWTDLTQAVRKVVYLYCLCGLSAKEIADELQLSVNTVNAHIRSAYGVLGATSRREAFERLVEGTEAAS